MSDAFYNRMQGIATNLLTRFNQGVIELGKVTPGTGPIQNPGPSTTVWTLLKGAARAPNYKEQQADKENLIKSGDLIVVSKIVAGVTPAMGDTVRFGGPSGQTWRVVACGPVPAVGIPVAWKLHVRRG